MVKHYSNFNIQKNHKGSIVLIGNFDGLHLGHQKLFKLAQQYKNKFNLKIGVINFDPMPKMYFNKKLKNFRLSNVEQKIKLLSKFKKLDCEIYGVSKDSIKSHDKFKEKYKIKFDLLADEEIKVLKKYKVWGKKKFMGREFMGTIRTTFLIDKKGGIIREARETLPSKPCGIL